MANTVIKLRRSSVGGKVPNTSTLSIGELGLNLTDKILYSSDGSTIFEIGANNSSYTTNGNIRLATNDKKISFTPKAGGANVYFTQQGDDNFVFYSTDTSNSPRAVWSIFANSVTSNLNISVPVNFNSNVGLGTVALYANGSPGSAAQVLSSNGTATYWATLATLATNTSASYTWTNTHTFQANVSVTSNGISVSTNTGAVYFNGMNDANWKIGRNTGATNKYYYTNNSLDIVAANSNLEGIVFGWTGNSYLEIGYAGTFTRLPIYVGNSSVNTTINSTSFTGTANNSLYLGGTAAASYVQNTDSRTLSGNLTFTGANLSVLGTNTYITSNVVIGSTATFYSINGQANASSGNFVANAYATLGGGGGNYLAFGQQTNFSQWIQSGYPNVSTPVYYNIILNPLGGNIGIGNTLPTHKLSVNGSTYFQGQVTFTQGITDSTGVQGNPGYILTSNGSGNVYWSSTANNATNLNSQPASYYTNATNITTGTLPYAQLGTNVVNTTSAFTFSGVHTHNANIVLGSSGLSANGSYGSAGQSLLSNGTATYWATAGATLNANNTDTQTYYIGLANSSTGAWTNAVVSTTKLYYVPSTGTLDASVVNAATHSVGTSFTANSTMTNTASLVVSTNTATIGTGTYFVSNGNVGVGISTPSFPLHVNKSQDAVTAFGVSNYTVGTSAAASFRLIGGTANSTMQFNLFDFNGSPYINMQTGTAVTGAYYDCAQHVYRNAAGTTEYVRFVSNGNVGIGTSAPARTLEILNTSNTYQTRLSVNSTSYSDIGHFTDGNMHLNCTGGYVTIDAPYLSVGSSTILLGTGGFGTTGDVVFRSTGSNSTTISPVFRIKDSVGGLADGIRFAPTWVNSISGSYQTVVNVSSLGVTFASINTVANTSTSVISWYGNVGVGNAAPSDKLSVNGTTYLGGSVSSSINLTANTLGVYHTGVINAASHTVGTAFTANSTVVNAVSYYAGATLIGNTTGPYGKTEGNLNVNSALTSNNSTYFGGALSNTFVRNNSLVQYFNPFITSANTINKYYSSITTNRFLGRGPQLYVTLDGVANSTLATKISDGDFETNYVVGTAGGAAVVLNINFVTNGLTNSAGFTYSTGEVGIYFYPGYHPSAITARFKDKNGVWTTATVSNTVYYVADAIGYKLSGIPGNYMTDIEITLTPQATAPMWLTEIEYHGSRMGLSEGPFVTVGGGTFYGNINQTANISISNTGKLIFAANAGIVANGGYGSAGHVLHSNGSAVYWDVDDQGVTSVATGNGMTGGTITTTGTVSVLANNGITANSTGLFVTQGTGTVVNATGVHVNSTYIGTLSANNTTYVNGKTEGNLNVNSAVYATNSINANNADYLDGQHGAYYAANSLLANYAPLAGATFSGDVTINANLVITGTTVTLNTATLDVKDKNITVAKGSTAAASDGAGITVDGSNVGWYYTYASNTWTSNVGITPSSNNTFDIGSTTLRWGTIYANNVTVTNLSGNGSSVTSVNAIALGGKTEGNLNVNSAVYANSSSTNTFTVGTAAYYVANGNFGIGNSTPADKLVVAGNIVPPSNGFANLGSLSLRWSYVYSTRVDCQYVTASSSFDSGSYGSSSGGVTLNQTGLYLGNTALTTILGVGSLAFGSSFTANTTGVYHVGTVNAASHTVGTAFTANSTVVNAVSYYAGTTLIGNTTGPYGKTEGNLNVNSAIYANGSSTNTFTVGTAAYYVANGNFGIGNSTPADKLVVVGNITPGTDNSYNLGSATLRWANVFTGDLHLSNERTKGNDIDGTTGNWTIQEGNTELYIINNKNGKKYKFKLEEIS